MISLNERAAEIVRRMMANAESLVITPQVYPSGVTVVDAGVETAGSLEAGRLFAEACMGGLGQVALVELDLSGLRLPGVSVSVSQPPLACIGAQLAGWPIDWGEAANRYRAMGSGPARALRREEPVFDELGYHDPATVAVLALEAGCLPPEPLAEQIAAQCGVSPNSLYLLVASIASLTGAVQVAARVVEAGMHKMTVLGFDVRSVVAGFGTCPLAPLTRDEARAIARANDAVLYGSRAWYTVQSDDEVLAEIIDQMPASASPEYGTSFYDLFERYNHDFYRIDPLLFSTAAMQITNLSTGHTFRAGAVDAAMVERTLLA
jgi:methenyltetrahydromethanopterin cyclohydrolase